MPAQMHARRNRLLLLCLSLLLVAFGQAALADARPNVVVIIASDLNGYGFHGGYPGAQVPAMERLKASSVTFEHAYAAAPASGPSRAALFSGLYPHSTGAYREGSNPWRKTLADVESLPELFRRSGYLTFGAGRLFDAGPVGRHKESPWENDSGNGGFGPLPGEKNLVRAPGEDSGAAGGRFWGVEEWTGPDQDFPDTVNADRAIGFLQQDHQAPFFLVYGLWRPHTPYTAPARFFDLYDPGEIDKPPGYLEGDLYDLPPGGQRHSAIRSQRWLNSGKAFPENWRRILHGYLAATSFADWNIGRVLDALDASHHADNTIVILWSDNGFHLGEKNHFGKATLWEQSARVPAAVRIPGSPNNGRAVKQPVSAVDLFPTLADYCGLEQTEHVLEGLSLRPLLEYPETTWKRPAITTYGENVFSARNERYRYIRYPDGEEELYDHRRDPHELRNLADKPDYRYVIGQFKQWIPEKFAADLGGRNG